MRKVIVILMVLIALGLIAADIAQAEDIPFPPDDERCDNAYVLKWMIPKCLYCEGIGDYYLFSCYDSSNNNLIFKHVCVYPTSEGDTIIEDIYFNHLPMIYGMDVIIGIPVTE